MPITKIVITYGKCGSEAAALSLPENPEETAAFSLPEYPKETAADGEGSLHGRLEGADTEHLHLPKDACGGADTQPLLAHEDSHVDLKECIKEEFKALGYEVFVLPAADSTPAKENEDLTQEDCRLLAKRFIDDQIECEKAFEKQADLISGKKVLMVCDRGICDVCEYVSQKEAEDILRKKGLSFQEARDSYDAVFYLEESDEDSDAKKKHLMNWVGHSHLRVVDAFSDPEKKKERLLLEIKRFTGEPEPLEIERKYLIEYPDIEYLEADPFCRKIEISQTYLKDSEGNFRVRKRGEKGQYIYIKNCKKDISDLVRTETEEKITGEEYENYLKNAGEPLKQIIKDRYCLLYNNRYFEVDVFPFWKDKALMEIELLDEDEKVELPPFIKVIRDVTSEKEYRNSALASHTFEK